MKNIITHVNIITTHYLTLNFSIITHINKSLFNELDNKFKLKKYSPYKFFISDRMILCTWSTYNSHNNKRRVNFYIHFKNNVRKSISLNLYNMLNLFFKDEKEMEEFLEEFIIKYLI